ncbi:MAG: hypothetical protein M1821_000085 [Bathelium mastoideum]|nr:MAG: hypothetical protein M1821_000085 [Bathelium mastoideum]
MEMAAGMEVLQHKNKGLREAIKVKNKKTAPRKQMAGDPQGVAVFYSPAKVADFRQEQQRLAQEKEQQQANKAAQRVQRALDKEVKRQEQQLKQQQREEAKVKQQQEHAARAQEIETNKQQQQASRQLRSKVKHHKQQQQASKHALKLPVMEVVDEEEHAESRVAVSRNSRSRRNIRPPQHFL